MSWTLSAAGRIEAGLEHLEEELHAELHKVLSDARFGLLFSHLQGSVVDRMHTVGQVPGAPEPEQTAAADVAPAVAAPPSEAAPTADPAPDPAAAEAPKAAAKTETAG